MKSNTGSGNAEPLKPLKPGIIRARPPAASDEPLRYRLLWQTLGWVMVAIVVWLSLTPTLPRPPSFLTWDKGQHVLAYAGLMYWYGQAFRSHWRWLLFLWVLGILLEFLQGLGGVRTSDPYDMLANSIGVLAGLGLARTRFGELLAGLDAWLGRIFMMRAEANRKNPS